jgi:hypothetical protein
MLEPTYAPCAYLPEAQIARLPRRSPKRSEQALVHALSAGLVTVKFLSKSTKTFAAKGRPTFCRAHATPVNDNLMEMLIMIDALKRASVNSVTAVMPYYGYGRQDRKVAPRTPISAKLVADLLTAAGCSRVVSMDLHAGQIQGFFNIPLDNLYSLPVIVEYLKSNFKKWRRCGDGFARRWWRRAGTRVRKTLKRKCSNDR